MTFSARLASPPQEKNGNWRLSLEDIQLENYTFKQSKAYVMLSHLPSDLQRSDLLTFSGKTSSSFGEYHLVMYRPQLLSFQKPDPPDYAMQFREAFSERLRTLISDEKASSLALAYLVGDKANLNPELDENIKKVGLSHIVVASGFHLGVFASFIQKRLKRFSRLVALIAALSVTLVFVGIAGFSPSLMRATIAFSFSAFFAYFGRKFHPIRLIAFSAALSLLINPDYIANLAWQLSFLSYFAIVVMSPIFIKYFFGDAKPNYFASSLIQSLCAQILCLAVILPNFGTFSILGPVANLIISPTIAPVMLFGVLAPVFPVFAIPLNLLLSLHIFCIDSLANLPWATAEVDFGNLPALIAPATLLLTLLFTKLAFFRFRAPPLLEKYPKYGKI